MHDNRPFLFSFYALLFVGSLNASAEIAVQKADAQNVTQPPASIVEMCVQSLAALPGPTDKAELKATCENVLHKSVCTSLNGVPIFHFDKPGTDKKGKKIFSLSLIHGDETPSGSVNRAWMTRLMKIDPRNTWRIIAIANPDGLKANTRYNAQKVDINRNFPSKDWEEKALAYWEKETKKDPRRNPGLSPQSEPETKCLVEHLNEFKPDFIISVHTPLGVLDFDGPKIGNPGFKPLPWVGLGNFPGSLGRFMWVDRKVPVLTIELKGNSGMQKLEDFDRLQDISGTVAIQAGKVLDRQGVQ